MRKHIPLKSTIRQPIRTLIFLLIVALASFGFISRAVEYVIISREINRIEQFYRRTGALIPVDAVAFANVYEAANLLRGSRYVEFEDRRTITQAIMHDIPNAMGGHDTFGQSFVRGTQPFSEWGLYAHDAIVIVEVRRIHTGMIILPPPHGDSRTMTTTKSLALEVIDVLHGQDNFHRIRQYQAVFEVDTDGNSIVDDMQQGSFYMVRMIEQRSFDPSSVAVDFFPLFDDVYFIDIYDEDAMRYTADRLLEENAILDQNTHMLMVTGTRDMTMMPLVHSGLLQRFQGRFIGYQDYLDANHVIVVPQRIDSTRRDARVGETITLTLRDMRTFLEGSPYDTWTNEGERRNLPAGYWVSIPRAYEGDWQNYPTIQIEVEVVGTYTHDMEMMTRWWSIWGSFKYNEVFVPASIIPEGFGLVDAHIVSGQYSFALRAPDMDVAFRSAYGYELEQLGFSVQFYGEDPSNFLMSVLPIRNSILVNLLLFAAVLSLALILTVFLYLRQRYKEFAILRALGTSGGFTTWQVLVPVLLLWIPVAVVAAIGGWYFAFNQVLDNLRIVAELDLLTDAAELAPVRNVLEQLRYEAEQALVRQTPSLDITYLVRLCAGLAAAWFAAVLVGTVLFARRSMISLLQSANGGGVVVRTLKDTEPPAVVKLTNFADALLIKPTQRSFGKLKSSVKHHSRHILRAPIKTLLVLAMAFLFIVSLGWLDRTIEFTQQEVDRLYATTIITGELLDNNNNIPIHSVERLMAHEFVENVYLEAIAWHNIFPITELDEKDENTIEVDIDSLSIGWTNFRFISCWDTFVQDANRPAVFGMGETEEFTVEFIPNFDPASLTQGWREIDWTQLNGTPPALVMPVPIVVHETLLSRHYLLTHGEYGLMVRYTLDEEGYHVPYELSLGDEVNIHVGHVRAHWLQTEDNDWVNTQLVPARIVGVYRGGHPQVAYRFRSPLVIVGDPHLFMFYSVRFTIAQEHVANLQGFVREMEGILTYNHNYLWTDSFGNTQSTIERYRHDVWLNDAEFNRVVIPLEENLYLLRLLYPIARAMSFVLGLGLSLLLMLQNAKNVAILRVLGSPGYKTRFNLCAEQLAVCVLGAATGFGVVLLLGVGVVTAGVLLSIYIAGTTVGTIIGIWVISNKTPLELLQVRE